MLSNLSVRIHQHQSIGWNISPGWFLHAHNPIKGLCVFLSPRGLFGRWHNPSTGTAAAQTLTSLALVRVFLRPGWYRPSSLPHPAMSTVISIALLASKCAMSCFTSITKVCLHVHSRGYRNIPVLAIQWYY